MMIFDVLVETSSQIETSTIQISPTPKENDPIIGVIVLCVFSVSGLCGFIILGYEYFKKRKDREISPRAEDGIDPYPFSEKPTTSEKSTITQPSRALTTNQLPAGNVTRVTNLNARQQQFQNRIIPLSKNIDINYNSSEKKNKIVKFGSAFGLNDNRKVSQTLNGYDILSNSILKEKKREVSLTCGECDIPIFSKNDMLSKSLSCKLCNSSEVQNDDLQHNIGLAELYIDKLTIAGQGTIGIKFQAKERFRIILNSNKEQSCGKSDVIVLDIGEDVTYFRKRNNDNPYDILALTTERKALLDKDVNQLYWLSHDKKNRRLRFGKGPMQSLLTVFCYDFPPQPSQGIDEYAWIENLRYAAISGVTFQKKDLMENKPKIELKSCNFPVTVDLPPFIINHNDATLDELETGNATVIDNLPEECKELYSNVVGSKISLNSTDFPDFSDAIEYSINTPGLACYEKLKEKASGFGDHNPKKTYLRITLGEDRGNSPGVPYVLEIWPSGHYSPVHSHSNSFGIIKVLYNEIVARYFTELQPKDQEWYYEVSFKEGQVTWISDRYYQTHQLWNRTRKVCATIQCYQYGDRDNDHYEYFDYIDNDNIVRKFKPNTDWPFSEFKRLIKKEWDRYKYLSGEISWIKKES